MKLKKHPTYKHKKASHNMWLAFLSLYSSLFYHITGTKLKTMSVFLLSLCRYWHVYSQKKKHSDNHCVFLPYDCAYGWRRSKASAKYTWKLFNKNSTNGLIVSMFLGNISIYCYYGINYVFYNCFTFTTSILYIIEVVFYCLNTDYFTLFK